MALTTDQPIAAHQRAAAPYRGARPAVSSAVAVAITALLGFAVTCWLALFTTRGQLYDETARQVLTNSGSATTAQLVELLQRISVVSAGTVLAALLVVALLRRRLRVALAAAILVIGANVSTELLKHYVLDRPDLGVGSTSNSLPSGHTTVVFSLVLAAVLVAPRALRWLVALTGAAVGALGGLATVIAGWHRPADVIAAMLVTLIWAAVVSAVVAGGPRDGRLGYSGVFPALIGGALAAIGLIVYGFGWSSGGDASTVIPFTAVVVAAVAGVGVGAYSRLVARTSN